MGRLRYIRGSEEAVAESVYVIHSPSLQGYFQGGRPLYLEVGMGKGRFITQMARLHPDSDFIGVERYESVMLKALQKYEALAGQGEAPENLRFLCVDAEQLGEYFPPGSVAGIYLNFSDPWPKERHAHRRLVSPLFLELFGSLMSEDGRIEFKTDNDGLFEYALKTAPQCGFVLSGVTRDLHGDPVLSEGNVMTEYEEKFSSRGNSINKLVMKKDPDASWDRAPQGSGLGRHHFRKEQRDDSTEQ